MSVLTKITFKELVKNKTRTAVTIIGVILSVAMITAVALFITSFLHFFIDYEIMKNGSWHAQFTYQTPDSVEKIADDDTVESCCVRQIQGYSLLENGKNPDKPYLYVEAWSPECYDMFTVNLLSGRLPQREGEIILPNHLSKNGGVNYALNDTFTVEQGRRFIGTNIVWQESNFYNEKSSSPETFTPEGERSYTVVGFYERPGFESNWSPGYTAITYYVEDNTGYNLSAYVCFKNMSSVFENGKRIAANQGGVAYHDDLLDCYGISQNDNYLTVMYSLGAIVIAIIMIGSVSLIYNSFSISVSERSKQFGMLSGAGASARQKRKMVFAEAGMIGIIGIPLGIAAGVGGIGLTFYLLRDFFANILSYNAYIKLYVSPGALVVAAVVGALTLLISAFIPARRAEKMSAIEAIRQTSDINIKSKKVKTGRLVQKLFGMEGTLALKNFRRNRRRYRATVISLVISIVLFISISSFTSLLGLSASVIFTDMNFDIMCDYNATSFDKEGKEIFDRLLKTGSVSAGSYYQAVSPCAYTKTSIDEVGNDTKKEALQENENTEFFDAKVDLCVLSDESFKTYAKAIGIKDDSRYFDAQNPRAVCNDNMIYQKGSKYIQAHLYSRYVKRNMELSWDSPDVDKTCTVEVEKYTDTAPVGVYSYASKGSIMLFISQSVFNSGVMGNTLPESYRNSGAIMMSFASDDPTGDTQLIKDALNESGHSDTYVMNINERRESQSSLLVILDVFSYGFIALISLIATANVFNTISTNINLRRREFAMLKSIGMTKRGFNKMMRFECVFYGLKALVIGIPISIVINLLIYFSITNGVDMDYFFPIKPILIASMCVFAVVFVTMLYSMHKVKKENIIDALKNENL